MMTEAENLRADSQKYTRETLSTALYLWAGMSIAMTLFYVSSQVVFVKAEPQPTSAMEWPLVILGALTFVFGYLFYPNYTNLRKKALLKAKMHDRKQTLLIAFVYQYVLFESLGLYGVMLSVMTQNPWKAVPFIVAAYVGFAVSFPRPQKVTPFFPEG